MGEPPAEDAAKRVKAVRKHLCEKLVDMQRKGQINVPFLRKIYCGTLFVLYTLGNPVSCIGCAVFATVATT